MVLICIKLVRRQCSVVVDLLFIDALVVCLDQRLLTLLLCSTYNPESPAQFES